MNLSPFLKIGNSNCRQVGILIVAHHFRYDNAAHKPALIFRAHKHTADRNVESAELPDVFDLINEIVRYL